MNGTRKRGLEPSTTAPRGMTPELRSIFDTWPQRFRTKVQISTYCWDWTACKDADGYGRYGTTRKRGTQPAHRMALELAGIDLPTGRKVNVDHLCRNHSCVRPDHLEIVPARVNVRRGATANSAGWCRSGRHPWTAENILAEAGGASRCRPCRDERERAYRPPSGNAPGDRTHCPQGHPYNEANTRVRPDGSRDCKVCHRDQARAAYHARKALAH